MTRRVFPFVGRTRELRCLREWLKAGRSVVLTGIFGSGRTALVRQIAAELSDRYRFMFLEPDVTRAELRRLVRLATVAKESRPMVLVIDDVCRLTPQKQTRWRELTQNGVQVVLIVERSVPSEMLSIIRASLGAAPLLSIGPLSPRATREYVIECSKRFGLGWNPTEIHGTARSTGGIPLTMRTTLDAAIERAREDRRALR